MNSRNNKSIENLENFRFGSSSSQTSTGTADFCRICHETDSISPLLTPCLCAGSLRFVHQSCLQLWLTASEMSSCELCKFPFVMTSKTKPFNEWRSLDMSGVERRRLFCAVLFHLAAALCVIWSLCVLIERSADEVRQGKLGWPFWTKLVVVTVGLTGGVVFMYIQCKQYLNLCSRWRARNRILLIQNAPEKVPAHNHSQSPVQNCHQSSVEPNNGQVSVSLHRNDSSNLVMNIPLNNNNNNNLNNNTMMMVMNNGEDASSHHQMISQPQHIVANIENNNSYELDDDISCSNISFKHHLRHHECEGTSLSRGSLHNIYNDNTSISTTNTSATTRNLVGDNDFHGIIPEGFESDMINKDASDGEQQRQKDSMEAAGGSAFTNLKLGTSVFIENSDILNDRNYPRIAHHHSQFLLPSAISPRFADAVEMRQKERRRYSDTKLLNSCEFENEFLINKTALFGESTRGKSEDMIFEKCDDVFDPIDLNIQNILEMDMEVNRNNNNKNNNNNNEQNAQRNSNNGGNIA